MEASKSVSPRLKKPLKVKMVSKSMLVVVEGLLHQEDQCFCQNHFTPSNHVCLYARNPVRCIPLQPLCRRERIRWCKEHIGWGHQQWYIVIFSDESRFTMILATSCFDEKGEHVMHNSMIVNVAGMTKTCCCGLGLSTTHDTSIFECGNVTFERYY